ncbi:S-adenosyl-L-methionine-dependent methyltransferase [Hypoxylon cercidicola]|nr:S-adenosyl-L-methionine-dependent methyltransferase [Hypoxylon cercidicola]
MSDPSAKPASSTTVPEVSTAASASATATKSPVPAAEAEAQTATGTTSANTPASPKLAETTETTAPTDAPDILPASHWIQAPQVYESDEDSSYGDDIVSSTASLSSSILEYRTLHGRTYHSERGNANSWNPNDAQHNESMEILHHASTLMQDGKLFLSPIGDDVQRVLDVGCGPGIWAIDFADMYPSAQVIGVDVSPTQPQWIPPNLKFEIDDVTLPWTYKPDTFDFIHMRWLVGSIEDWYGLYKEIFRTLKPGKYFENKESSAIITSDDGTVTDDSALSQWGKVFNEAGKQSGKTFRVVEDDIQRKAMEAAGFVDIEEHVFKARTWPAEEKMKELGQFLQLALYHDIEGFLMMVWTNTMKWSVEEIHIYSAHLRRELRSKNLHPYYIQKVVIGRKPNVGEVP